MGAPLRVKGPPITEISAFIAVSGLASGGVIRTDQGGELAKCKAFCTTLEKYFNYKVESTGADSPSQNGGIERWNLSLASTVWTLLYGASLPAHF